MEKTFYREVDGRHTVPFVSDKKMVQVACDLDGERLPGIKAGDYQGYLFRPRRGAVVIRISGSGIHLFVIESKEEGVEITPLRGGTPPSIYRAAITAALREFYSPRGRTVYFRKPLSMR